MGTSRFVVLELECGLKNVLSLEAMKSTLISMDLTLKITFLGLEAQKLGHSGFRSSS